MENPSHQNVAAQAPGTTISAGLTATTRLTLNEGRNRWCGPRRDIRHQGRAPTGQPSSAEDK
jgi:hypothetical protein